MQLPRRGIPTTQPSDANSIALSLKHCQPDEYINIAISSDDIPITVMISDLRRKKVAGRLFTVEVKAGSRTRIDEIIISLMERGMIYIY